MGVARRVILSVVSLLIVAYMLLAFTVFNEKPRGMKCRDVELISRDTTYSTLITKRGVLAHLDAKGLNPVGRDMDSISLAALERELSTNALIEDVECYKTLGGKVCIEVKERVPILHIMSADGDDYYIDQQGHEVPYVSQAAFYLPVVTGQVEKTFARQKLHSFGLFLQKDAFWNAQIEQINVLPGGNIELVPRVGDNIIYLGSIDGFERKLDRVHKFYTEALNKVGWNKYKRISVEFDNQIICTKR